ncbi:MAG: DMT family transporter [Firmicutes bacterium]|nr:DMT family transporter [Bacillota bacterium]
MKKARAWADASLLIVTLIWGSAFVLVKDIVRTVPPIVLVATRFLAATVLLGAVMAPRLRFINRRLLAAGSLIGVILFSGFILQTVGIEYTSASKAAFITALSVVMVPLFAALVLKQKPTALSLIGAGLAMLGLALLTLHPGPGAGAGGHAVGGLLVNAGDIIIFMGAIAFALHIVFVGRYAPSLDVPLLVLIQMATVAIISWAEIAIEAVVAAIMWDSVQGLMRGFDRGLNLPDLPCRLAGWWAMDFRSVTPRTWVAILFLGVFGTALAFFIQNAAQRFTTPTRVAIIFSTEPVFTAIFARVFFGEALGMRGVLGSILILAGTIVAELPARGDG